MSASAKAQTESDLLRQRIHEFRHVFDLFDKDGDGSLSLEEVKALLEKLGMRMSYSDLHSVLSELDSNNNGKLEFSEFLNLVLDRSHQQESLNEAFRMFDLDGDGQITIDEIRHVVEHVFNGKMSDRRFRALMEAVDRNGDGKIDFKEFTKVMTSGKS